MTRTTRRETDRLRAEIMDGLAEYRDGLAEHRLERERERRIKRCGTVVGQKDMPRQWLHAMLRICAPEVTFLPEFRFGISRPQPLLH